jgi:vacuolar-type H+-ATPase subunit E/Vma4
MSLEAMEKDIEKEAEKKAEDIAKEADSESRSIIGEAKKAAEKILADAKASADAEKRRILAEGRADAELTAKLLVSDAKSYAIDNAVKKVNAKVAARLSKPENMKRLIEAAIKQFEGMGISDFVVSASSDVLPKKEKLQEAIEPARTKGKAALYSKDKRIKIVIDASELAEKYSDFSRREAERAMFGTRGEARHAEPKRAAKAKKRTGHAKASEKPKIKIKMKAKPMAKKNKNKK